jgi:hypothetical protein
MSMKEFCRLVLNGFGEYYLNRTPSQEMRDRILKINSKRGFPGTFASWYCSHFKCNKCPVQYHGAYNSRYNNSENVVLECVVDCYFWLWIMNFGNAGTLSNINILDKSSKVSSIWRFKFDLKCSKYKVNNLVCDFMYFWWMVPIRLGASL